MTVKIPNKFKALPLGGAFFLKKNIMIDLWQTIGGVSVKRAKLLSEGQVFIETFRNDAAFRVEMMNMIKIDQLRDRGVDETGEVIGYYSFVTSLINPEKQFNTHYTLDDTGDLLRSLFVSVTMDHFQLDWNDEKIQDQSWWSPQILGFTDENLEIISQRYFDNLGKIGFALLSNDL